MEIQNFFLGKDCVEQIVGEGVTRKILAHHENLMVCELHFEKGSVGALHTHPHEQCTYIISGKFEFEIFKVVHVMAEPNRYTKTRVDIIESNSITLGSINKCHPAKISFFTVICMFTRNGSDVGVI